MEKVHQLIAGAQGKDDPKTAAEIIRLLKTEDGMYTVEVRITGNYYLGSENEEPAAYIFTNESYAREFALTVRNTGLTSRVRQIIPKVRHAFFDDLYRSGFRAISIDRNHETMTLSLFAIISRPKNENGAVLNPGLLLAANTFYHDAHNLAGKCDYVMANPPFNVDKVKAESASAAGRLPFGLPGVNQKTKEIGNANYLWISYFYAYLNDHGRAGFVMASSATDSANKDRDIREKLVRTGDVDVVVSVGNNFFYTLSLPCSLWFFDRNKHADIRDKVLFIDARNYYTVVDRTLNEWTEWQLRNLQAIVHLYRGEKEKYQQLLADYQSVLGDTTVASAQEALDKQKAIAKEAIANATRKGKKRIEAEQNALIAELEDTLETARQHEWLTEKFGDGEYHDVLGLCKIATIQEIEEKNYSLTPGAYVGVAEQEDDGVDFHERMTEIHAELAQLNKEANVLMDEIMKEWKNLNMK